MKNINLPIRCIGEKNWVENLSQFLENNDVEVLPLSNTGLIEEMENKLEWKIPNEIKEYYINSGVVRKRATVQCKPTKNEILWTRKH